MRISIALMIFLVLFNGWAGLLQQYDIDEQLGINAEVGDHEELEEAQANAKTMQTGDEVGGTLLGYYNGLTNTISSVLQGIAPGVQMLVNVAPSGIVTDVIIWAFSITPFIILADLAAYARGVDL